MPTLDDLRKRFTVGVALQPEPDAEAELRAREAREDAIAESQTPTSKPESRVEQPKPQPVVPAKQQAKPVDVPTTTDGKATPPSEAQRRVDPATLTPEKRDRIAKQSNVLMAVKSGVDALAGHRGPCPWDGPMESFTDSKGGIYSKGEIKLGSPNGRQGGATLVCRVWNRKFMICQLKPWASKTVQFMSDPKRGDGAPQLIDWLQRMAINKVY